MKIKLLCFILVLYQSFVAADYLTNNLELNVGATYSPSFTSTQTISYFSNTYNYNAKFNSTSGKKITLFFPLINIEPVNMNLGFGSTTTGYNYQLNNMKNGVFKSENGLYSADLTLANIILKFQLFLIQRLSLLAAIDYAYVVDINKWS